MKDCYRIQYVHLDMLFWYFFLIDLNGFFWPKIIWKPKSDMNQLQHDTIRPLMLEIS